MASPASSTMRNNTRPKTCKGVRRDASPRTRVSFVRGCQPLRPIAEAVKFPNPLRGRILRLRVCTALPCACSPRACDCPAGVELAALCSLSEGRWGLDAARAGDGSAPGRQRQLQYRPEHLGRRALPGLADAAVP